MTTPWRASTVHSDGPSPTASAVGRPAGPDRGIDERGRRRVGFPSEQVTSERLRHDVRLLRASS